MGILKYMFLAKSRLVSCTFQLSLMYLSFWIHQRHGKVSWSPLSCSLLPLPPPPPNTHTHTHTNTHTQTHIQTHTHTHTHTHTRIAILLPHKDCKFYETFRKYSTCKFSGTFSFRFPPKGRHHYKYQRYFSKHLFL